MTTTFEENGKQYTIENGRVTTASAVPAQEETVDLTVNDRVVIGKKLGTIRALTHSVYGLTAAVKCDDGTIVEKLVEDLSPAPVDKTAAVTVDSFEEEYNEYLAMSTDTAEELEIKEAKARELNLRAKALQTNSHLPLSDQILYDHVVTATAVDAIDLRDQARFARAAEDDYLETLPRYTVTTTVESAGGTSRGDASWLGQVADEIEPEVINESVLADRATKMVASFEREELESDLFMKKALRFSFENLPEDKDVRQRFAKFAAEAREQKLAEQVEVVKVAGTDTFTDLEGNSFTYDDVPVEALFG